MEAFNARFALWVTEHVGTMWCAYLFGVLALISLPNAIQSGSVVVIVGWVSQTFLQLVLLAVIMVGQNIQGGEANAKIHQHLQAQDELLTAVRAFQVRLDQQDEVLAKLRRLVDTQGPTTTP